MRTFFRSVYVFSLSAMIAWAVSLSTFVRDLGQRTVHLFREMMIWSERFIPRLADLPRLVRRIGMGATALNDRDLGGVRCRGDLGPPAMRMLAG